MIFIFECEHEAAGDLREVKRGQYVCNRCNEPVRRDVVAEQRNAARKVQGIGGKQNSGGTT